MRQYTSGRDLILFYRHERAEKTNLKKGSLARGWANFLFFQINLRFCIFCRFLYFPALSSYSATIVLPFCDRKYAKIYLKVWFLIVSQIAKLVLPKITFMIYNAQVHNSRQYDSYRKENKREIYRYIFFEIPGLSFWY